MKKFILTLGLILSAVSVFAPIDTRWYGIGATEVSVRIPDFLDQEDRRHTARVVIADQLGRHPRFISLINGAGILEGDIEQDERGHFIVRDLPSIRPQVGIAISEDLAGAQFAQAYSTIEGLMEICCKIPCQIGPGQVYDSRTDRYVTIPRSDEHDLDELRRKSEAARSFDALTDISTKCAVFHREEYYRGIQLDPEHVVQAMEGFFAQEVRPNNLEEFAQILVDLGLPVVYHNNIDEFFRQA